MSPHILQDSAPNSAWLEKAGGTRFPLSGNCALGRSSSNTIVVADPKASRHHATIHVQDAGEFWLIDLGSINGTLRNGLRVVQPVRLKNGDRITLADTTFAFRQKEPPEEASHGTTSATVAEVRQEMRWLLLADIEGFTPMSQRLPAEKLAEVVGQWIGAGREIVERHGGAMNKYTGDGYLACWPGGSESAAHVAAAVLAFRRQRDQAGPRFRIIVHHGKVAMGGAIRVGEDYLLGSEVNFIFRVEKVAAALGAAFCFSTAAATLLGKLLPLAPISGGHQLKGFPGIYDFFQLPES